MYDFGSTLFAQDFHFAHLKKSMAFSILLSYKNSRGKRIWNMNGNFTALSRQIFVDQSDHNAVNSSSISINNACKQGKDIFSNGMLDFYLLGLANDSYLKNYNVRSQDLLFPK